MDSNDERPQMGVLHLAMDDAKRFVSRSTLGKPGKGSKLPSRQQLSTPASARQK